MASIATIVTATRGASWKLEFKGHLRQKVYVWLNKDLITENTNKTRGEEQLQRETWLGLQSSCAIPNEKEVFFKKKI